MIYGMIICAGKQSRFKSETPKALINLNGEVLLSKNINALQPFCDKIYVVCSVENQMHFTKEILGVAEKIVISSGKGSGDAVWQALELVKPQKDDACLVMWGDCLQKEETISKLVQSYKGNTIIACTKEDNPYVQILDNGKGGVMASFSKFNEPITAGFHDLSIFLCNATDLIENLRIFRNKIMGPDGQYIHKHKNEMEFLDVFNETDIKAEIFEFLNYKEFAFNTLEQLEDLINKQNNN